MRLTPLRLSTTLLLASLTCTNAFADNQAETAVGADDGFTLGFGFVSTLDAADSPFPTLRSGEYKYMLLPNLSYRWQDWSLGSNGLGWQKNWSESLSTNTSVGYPRSQFSLTAQRGWLRYGGDAELNYSDGLSARISANVAGLSYGVRQGLDERAGQWQQELSFSAPLYISKRSDSIVLGTVRYQRQNTAFSTHELSLSGPLDSQTQDLFGIGAFSVWQWTPKLTTLFAVDLSWPDAELTQSMPELGTPSTSLFFMLSYFVGKL